MEEIFEEYVTFHVTASDGSDVEMAVVDEFDFEDKHYVVGAVVTDDTIDDEGRYIYESIMDGDDFTVKKIAKDFGIEESKGEIDYTKKRPLGYEPDANEMEYVTNDVLIVCKALRQQFEQDLTKMTISSDGLNFAKGQIGKKRWQALFPGAGCIDR